MLNYILPPIIIVISVSFLIVFLFRKVEQLPLEDAATRNDHPNKKRMSLFLAAAGQFGLKILERAMHRSKLLSLKFHNTSNVWFHSIREKRQRQEEHIQQEIIEREIEEQEGEKLKPEITMPDRVQEIAPKSQSTARQMVRDTIARPQRSSLRNEKSQLEEVLIKRIAINPKDIEAYERLGDYYLESMNYQDSLECFKQVLRLSPVHNKAKLRIRRLERMIK